MNSVEFMSELRPLMGDTVRWRSAGGADLYGARSYGAWSTPIACYISLSQREVRNQQGETTVQRGAVYLDGVYAVDTDDQLELPDGDLPVILQVDTLRDEEGAVATVVRFQ